MKLNHDCIRDVMIYIEENCIYEDDDRGNRSIHSRVFMKSHTMKNYRHDIPKTKLDM